MPKSTGGPTHSESSPRRSTTRPDAPCETRRKGPGAELERLAEDVRVDLLRLVGTDEIGLHSYPNFVN